MKCEYLQNDDRQRKMLKYDFYRGLHSSSNEIIANDVLGGFDLNFQGKHFKPNISDAVRSSVKMRRTTFKDWYSPSNGIVVNSSMTLR